MWEELSVTPLQGLEVVVSTAGMYWALVVLVRVLGQRVLARMANSDLATVVALGAVIGRASLGYTPTLGAGLLALGTLFGRPLRTGEVRTRVAFWLRADQRTWAGFLLVSMVWPVFRRDIARYQYQISMTMFGRHRPEQDQEQDQIRAMESVGIAFSVLLFLAGLLLLTLNLAFS
ncbi:UNVERIFIED_ORG: hypothetical protein ABIB52_004470 [Arthrobacter sp. UYCu721]